MRSVSIGLFVLSAALPLLLACSDDEGGGTGGTSGSVQNGGAGCGTGDAPKGSLAKQTIQAAGDTRGYELFVPDGHDGKKAFPLVFVFHGSGGDGAGVRKGYPLEAEAKGEAIFVYPDGKNRQWDLDDKADKNADIALFDALLDRLSKSYCVDKSRVFATGYSNGAYFSNQLGCRRGSVIRAVASHAGGGPFGADDEYGADGNLVCPESAVAALISHGTDDGTVSLDEGHKSRDYWQYANGCKTTSSPWDPSPCVSFDGCAAGRPVVYCEVPGLGHAVWPTSGPKATWQFFAALGSK